jgi:hypothetical protein
MSLCHIPLAYLVGRDHCTDILNLMTPTQLLIAFLRASGRSDREIGRSLGLDSTSITRAMERLALRIAEEIPELRVTLDGRARCPSPMLEDSAEASAHGPSPISETVSAPEAAARLHQSPRTIRLWCQQGRFPHAYKRGGYWRIPEADLGHGARRPAGDEPLTVAEAAQRLGTTPRAIRERCRQGRLPGAYRDEGRPNGPWCIPEGAVVTG